MKIKSYYNKLLFVTMVFFTASIFFSTTAKAANSWTNRQEKAHEIAELARAIGLPETDPIIKRAQELWWDEIGANTDMPPKQLVYCEADAKILAKIIYSESRGIPSDTEKACIAWAVLNRVDAGYGSTIKAVATAPYQFAYNPYTPLWDSLYELSLDVLQRWQREKNGETDVGRVLPKDYLWYHGDGRHNYFRNSYSGGRRWDYSLDSPYST